MMSVVCQNLVGVRSLRCGVCLIKFSARVGATNRRTGPCRSQVLAVTEEKEVKKKT